MLDQTSSPSRHVDRQEAATLLAPLSLDEFRRRYWEREPVLIRGSIAKLERLGLTGLNRDGFAREVQRAADEARAGFVVGALRTDWDDAAQVQSYEYIEAQAVDRMVAQGSSIAIDNFGDQQLAELIAALAQQLGHAGEVRVDGVLSPAGEGFPLHMDKGSVIIVQVAGRKRWRISEEPALRWPSGTTAFASSGEVVHRDFVPEPWEQIEQIEIPPLRELVLEPGDVLYIPAGTLHTTLAMDEPSLSVSLLFSPCRTLDLFGRVLADKLGADPAWRNVPGVGTPGALSDEAREFLAARLAELRELVNGLTPDDLALNCEWQRRLAQLGTATHARLAPTPVDESFVIAPSTRLRRTTRVPITHVQGCDEDGEPYLIAFHRDRELSVHAEWTGFLRSLLAAEEFVAEAACSWFEPEAAQPWEDVRETLHALLVDGVLELA